MTGSAIACATGVLVTGLFGSGKSTVVEEMAHLLEVDGVPYAALDLDWLWWFDVPGMQRRDALPVLCTNVRSLVDAYLAAGVTRFVLAWSLRDRSDLAALRKALPCPLQVAELTVPLPIIEARLGGAITAGRSDDLREARRWFDQGLGLGFGDIEVRNDRPIREVAAEILSWLGWA